MAVEGLNQDNKENIPPFTSSKKVSNVNPVVRFHNKSIKCRKISTRKPLQDITHLFNSSEIQSTLILSRSVLLISPLSNTVFGHESNTRKKKLARVNAHLKDRPVSKSLRMNFRWYFLIYFHFFLLVILIGYVTFDWDYTLLH